MTSFITGIFFYYFCDRNSTSNSCQLPLTYRTNYDRHSITRINLKLRFAFRASICIHSLSPLDLFSLVGIILHKFSENSEWLFYSA